MLERQMAKVEWAKKQACDLKVIMGMDVEDACIFMATDGCSCSHMGDWALHGVL